MSPSSTPSAGAMRAATEIAATMTAKYMSYEDAANIIDRETAAERDQLNAINAELVEAAICAQQFIQTLKSCIPDWMDQLGVSEEGYSTKLRAAIAKATEGGK